jgi:hypothetical protein
MAKKNGHDDDHEDLMDGLSSPEAMTHLRQLEIPGAGRKRDRQGDVLCSTLLDLVQREKELRNEKKLAQEAVQRWLERKGWPAYVFVDGETKFMVTREASEKVKVQRIGPKGDSERHACAPAGASRGGASRGRARLARGGAAASVRAYEAGLRRLSG